MRFNNLRDSIKKAKQVAQAVSEKGLDATLEDLSEEATGEEAGRDDSPRESSPFAGSPGDTRSLSERSRGVHRWPHDLRLRSARICLSYLQDGDTSFSRARASSEKLKSISKQAKESLDTCSPTLSGLGREGALRAVGALSVLTAKVVKTPAILEKKKPGMLSSGFGFLSHVVVEMDLVSKDGEGSIRHCFLERSSDYGVVVLDGRSGRQPLVVCREVDAIDQNVTLGDILEFREEEDEVPYSLLTSNCIHTGYKFWSKVLQEDEYGTCKEFARAMREEFLLGLKRIGKAPPPLSEDDIGDSAFYDAEDKLVSHSE